MKRIDIVGELTAISFLIVFVCMCLPSHTRWWVPVWNLLCAFMQWHGSYMA